MKKKGLIILIGIVMCFTITACGTEESLDNEPKTEQATIIDEKRKEKLAEAIAKAEAEQKMQKEQKSNYNLTYELTTDIKNGLLYYTEAGKLTDPDGKIIPEYDEYYVSNGYVIYAGAACEGCRAENGKIVYKEPEPMLSGIEKLRACASWDNCTTSTHYFGSLINTYYQIDDDGDYFDEVVLGAWFNESGVPLADLLPQTLFDVLNEHGEGNASTSALKFIDSENCTVNEVKRASTNKKNIYAFVLSGIEKRESNNEVYIVGREFTSGESLVVHGKFDKILNGDDLLVFGFFNGLASDDTPNFQGKYLQVVNGRLN